MPKADPATMASIVTNFRALLSRPDVIEGDVQSFMEEHTELIPVPFLLGHDLHMGCVISKFEMDRCRKPDFAYLTKNTGNWRLVLTELERPQKTLFTQATHADFHGDTRAAISQIEDWKTRAAENLEDVRKMLMPLLMPADFRTNPMQIHYLLVIGRNPTGRYTPEQRSRIRRLEEESKISLITYDSIIRMTEHDTWKVGYKKNILIHHRNSYRLKKANDPSTRIFAWYLPDEIDVPAEHIDWFKSRGYHMDDWLRGERLIFNGKWPQSKEKEFYDSIMAAGAGVPTAGVPHGTFAPPAAPPPTK